jgi:predicted alpha/beta-fold hydrolase
VGARLAALAMPAYLIAAEDDPIIPVDDLKRIDAIETLRIETCRHGGHCGFIENLAARSWVEARMLQILRNHLK